MHERIDKIKRQFAEWGYVYTATAVTTVVVAGITTFIVGGITSQHISRGIPVTAKGGISVLGKNVVMNNVSYISSNRQGPPSWVVRCVETGKLFTSQKSAAVEMDLLASEVSKHLNGIMDNVRGYHFERICMAA